MTDEVSGIYKWHPPIARQGDRVECWTHRNTLKDGTLLRVETCYSLDGEAFHSYTVDFGWKRHQHLPGSQIVRVLPKEGLVPPTPEPVSSPFLKYLEAISGFSEVVPELEPISSGEISEFADKITFHPDLVQCWLQIGCGFFSKDISGARLTSFQNRLMGPDEIEELGAFPFALGVPFFEIAFMTYIVIQPDGVIVHECGTHISDNLEVFLYDLVREPEFWLHV